MTTRQNGGKNDTLARLPEDRRREVLEFLTASAAPIDANQPASDVVLASVAAAAILSGDPRH